MRTVHLRRQINKNVYFFNLFQYNVLTTPIDMNFYRQIQLLRLCIFYTPAILTILFTHYTLICKLNILFVQTQALVIKW